MHACPDCGVQNKDTAKFCNACGHRMATSLAPGDTLQGGYLIVWLSG